MAKIAAVLAILVGVTVASGNERKAPIGVMTFDIPAQPLIDALQAYSQQADVQVMFETTSAAGLRSQPVNGEFTPQAALLVLLADADLRVRYSRSNAVTLAPASAPDPDQPPVHPPVSADITLGTLRVRGTGDASDRNLGEYIGLMQTDIQRALKRSGRNRRGEYRVAIKLWVTPSSRVVDRAELDGSTGDLDRDSSIAEALRGLVLSQQAPPNMPLPIRFMISIHAL
ncbi:STN domain-containing protein [Bradyrhizobium cenepequi]